MAHFFVGLVWQQQEREERVRRGQLRTVWKALGETPAQRRLEALLQGREISDSAVQDQIEAARERFLDCAERELGNPKPFLNRSIRRVRIF